MSATTKVTMPILKPMTMPLAMMAWTVTVNMAQAAGMTVPMRVTAMALNVTRTSWLLSGLIMAMPHTALIMMDLGFMSFGFMRLGRRIDMHMDLFLSIALRALLDGLTHDEQRRQTGKGRHHRIGVLLRATGLRRGTVAGPVGLSGTSRDRGQNERGSSDERDELA